MAKIYLEKLNKIYQEIDLENAVKTKLEIKHFFNGAALYSNGKICASFSPSGLAFKLPESVVIKLISSGKAKELKYFDNGNVKKDYAVFENPEILNKEELRDYFLKAIKQ